MFLCCVQVISLLHYATDIIRACSEILFSEGLCRVEASYLIFNANRLTGFCMEGSFTGKYYRTNHNLFLFYLFVCFLLFLIFVLFCFFREVRDRLDICNIILQCTHLCQMLLFVFSKSLGVSWYLGVVKLIPLPVAFRKMYLLNRG